MELPNRQQRRKWAKEMGLLKQKKNSSLEQQREMSLRAAETGKQIHLRNTERNLEREDKLKQAKEELKNDIIVTQMTNDGSSQEDISKVILKDIK
jgi:hypothetical protein